MPLFNASEPSMLKALADVLDGKGYEEAKQGKKGHYVIERAFVEK